MVHVVPLLITAPSYGTFSRTPEIWLLPQRSEAELFCLSGLVMSELSVNNEMQSHLGFQLTYHLST